MAAGNPSGTSDATARTAIWLYTIGAVLGLGIAGFGLFTAQGTRIWTVPPEDAAIVGGVPILRSDLVDQLRALDDSSYAEATPARRRAVLADMIREELTVQRGIEMGLANDDIDVRAALAKGAAARLDTLETGRPVSETDIGGWYVRHRATYATAGIIAVSDQLRPDPASAEMLTQALRTGAAARPTPSPRFYPQVRAALPAPLFAAAARMRAGDVSDPIGARDGWHVLVVTLHRPPVPLPLAAVREQILVDIHRDRLRQTMLANRRGQRRQAVIAIAEDLR